MGMTIKEPEFVMTRGLLLDYERRAAFKERERIIKLLVDELYINPNSNYGQQLIALIKGEQK